jgi:hypothetical protein
MRSNYYGIGLRSFFRQDSSNEYFHDYFHFELHSGFYYPIKMGGGKVTLTPHANIGVGFEVKDKLVPDGDDLLSKKDPDIGLSFIIGIQFTSSAVPGLYLFADYQYNLFGGASKNDVMNVPHAVFLGLGYTFTF